MQMRPRNSTLGSARVSRAGECVRAFANFPDGIQQKKFVVAGRNNQHARRVRYPESVNSKPIVAK